MRRKGHTDRQKQTTKLVIGFAILRKHQKKTIHCYNRCYSCPLCVTLPSAYTVLLLVLPQRSSINVCLLWLHYAIHRKAYISTEIFARISKTYVLHFVRTEFYALALPYRISPTRKYSISYGDTLIFPIIAKGHRIS